MPRRYGGNAGSRIEARIAHLAAAAAGLRVIALDRPGYGLSDFLPGRSLTDWPAARAMSPADAEIVGRP